MNENVKRVYPRQMLHVEREKNTTTHAIQYIILQYKDGEPEIIAQVNEFLKSQKHIEVVVFFASVRMHMPILNK